MAVDMIKLGMALQRMQDEFAGVTTLSERLQDVIRSGQQAVREDPSRAEQVIDAVTGAVDDITRRFGTFKAGADAALDQLDEKVRHAG